MLGDKCSDAEIEEIFHRVKAGERSTLKIETSSYTIMLEEHAHLSLEVETSHDNSVVQSIEVWQAAHSQFEIFYAHRGQGVGRYNLHVHLQGEHARCRAFGCYQMAKNDQLDHHLWIEHAADHTRSEQFFKGIVDGQSRVRFNGKATVHAKVKQAEVRQHNFNLLLSKTAEVETKPELEIFADQVKAVHAATVGQLDEEALFYLRSRGISEASARQMMIAGFLEEVRERFLRDRRPLI